MTASSSSCYEKGEVNSAKCQKVKQDNFLKSMFNWHRTMFNWHRRANPSNMRLEGIGNKRWLRKEPGFDTVEF